MSVEQMRNVILDAYSGDSWKLRVSKMSDEQVIAVYYKLLDTGKLNKKTLASYRRKEIEAVVRNNRYGISCGAPVKSTPKKNDECVAVQISFDDILRGRV